MRRLVALTALLLVAGCGEAQKPPPEPAPFTAVHKEPQRPEGRWLTARITEPVRMRARPGGRKLERLRTRTEFGSPKVVSVVEQRDGWLAVLVPERPNGRPGWIPASAAKLGGTDVSIRVDRSARQLVVRDGRKVLRRMRVAVGQPGTPTPLGRFAITDKLRTRAPDSPYGCCALALTGHQPKLVRGWPGGDRLAIHATPQPQTVGKAASLGCLRAHSRDVQALLRVVPLGAPVFVGS